MAIVPDCSSLLCLAFDDEDVTYGTTVVDGIRAQGAMVPSIFWFEIRNGLVANERRKRISVVDSSAFLGLLADLPIEIEPIPPEVGVLEFARTHGLSVYDAAYLDLASRGGVPVATLDQRMRDVARTIGIAIWPER